MPFPIRIGQKDNIESTSDFGPHLISGLWYLVNKEGSGSCDVYTSADSGVTWVGQDLLDLNAGEAFYVLWDLPNGIIYALRNKGATTTSALTKFDTATNLWIALDADGPTLEPLNVPDQFLARMVQVSSGDVWVIYATKISSSPKEFQLNYIKNSGGVWGTPQILVAASPGVICNYLQSVVVDATDLIHIFYKQNNTGTENEGNLYHISLTTAGVISSPTLIDTNMNYSSAGRPSILGTSIILPYFNNSRLAGVYTGTPLIAPVWSTFTLVDTNSLGAGVVDDGFGSFQGTTSFSFVSGSVLYLIWQSTNSDGSYAINRVYYAVNGGGAWSAPILLYDEVANPGAWYGTNNPDLYAMTGNVIAGNIQVMSNVNCEGAAFIGSTTPPAPPAPGTLTITCGNPPAGQVGVPY